MRKVVPFAPISRSVRGSPTIESSWSSVITTMMFGRFCLRFSRRSFFRRCCLRSFLVSFDLPLPAGAASARSAASSASETAIATVHAATAWLTLPISLVRITPPTHPRRKWSAGSARSPERRRLAGDRAAHAGAR